MSRYLRLSDLSPALQEMWRALPSERERPAAVSWSVWWWRRRDRTGWRPCRGCGQLMDPVITTPPPEGCGRDVHPLCDSEPWLTGDTLAAAASAAARAAGAST